MERFLRYIKVDTRSDDRVTDRTPFHGKTVGSGAPSGAGELKDLGLEEVELDQQCFLTATLPANTKKKLPMIGFLAHLDTSTDFEGSGVKAQIVEKYDGRDIPLKGKGRH